MCIEISRKEREKGECKKSINQSWEEMWKRVGEGDDLKEVYCELYEWMKKRGVILKVNDCKNRYEK